MEAGLSEAPPQKLEVGLVMGTTPLNLQEIRLPPKITPAPREMLVDKEMLVPSPMLHLPLARLNLEDAADAVEDRAAEDRAEIAAVAPEDVVDPAADAAAAKWFI